MASPKLKKLKVAVSTPTKSKKKVVYQPRVKRRLCMELQGDVWLPAWTQMVPSTPEPSYGVIDKMWTEM